MECVLTDPKSVKPQKNNESDSGYDLTLIDVKKKIGEVVMYGTGVKVQAPVGYYFDLVPRSSIIKTGYIMANNIGIIDHDYTGEIMVPLIKVDKNANDLELPLRLMQLIPRKVYNFDVKVVEQLKETVRADKGFGSSGN